MGGDYRAILADPPWQYRTFKPGTKTRHIDRPGIYPVAVHSYGTMTPQDLQTLPVDEMCAKHAALFMWATMPCLPEAIELMGSWGFSYRTVAFTWVKSSRDGSTTIKGMGHYTRSNAELCLIGVRGSMPVNDRAVEQVILSSRREHSRKPDEQYDRIMRLFDGPYLELFARQQWPGWDVWGNEAGKFPAQTFLIPEAMVAS